MPGSLKDADQSFNPEEVPVDSSLIRILAAGIGDRPPTSDRERVAAEVIAGELGYLGLDARIEDFRSQRSFGSTYLAIFGLSLAGGTLWRRRSSASKVLGALSSLLAAGLGAAESRFALKSPLNLLRTGESQNVTATINSSGPAEQTICLVSHMDASRSGLMFHPGVTPHLGSLVGLSGAAVLVSALVPLLDLFKAGRLIGGVARMLVGASAAMILEREVRGRDVPGANDNASGVAACVNLASYFSGRPLARSRIVILVTGSEESGVIGMRDFLRNNDTTNWLFVNFDGVSAEAPLRVLSRENGPLGPHADPELLAAAEEAGLENPELRAEPLRDGSGLPYDSTSVMARGGKAISVVNQEAAIPDYHWPTDTANRVSEPSFAKAVRFGAALLRTLDKRR